MTLSNQSMWVGRLATALGAGFVSYGAYTAVLPMIFALSQVSSTFSWSEAIASPLLQGNYLWFVLFLHVFHLVTFAPIVLVGIFVSHFTRLQFQAPHIKLLFWPIVVAINVFFTQALWFSIIPVGGSPGIQLILEAISVWSFIWLAKYLFGAFSKYLHLGTEQSTL
jgi:hypothetical protein